MLALPVSLRQSAQGATAAPLQSALDFLLPEKCPSQGGGSRPKGLGRVSRKIG